MLSKFRKDFWKKCWLGVSRCPHAGAITQRPDVGIPGSQGVREIHGGADEMWRVNRVNSYGIIGGLNIQPFTFLENSWKLFWTSLWGFEYVWPIFSQREIRMCSICGLNVKGRLWIQVAGIRYYHIITLYIQTYIHTCRHADMQTCWYPVIQTYRHIYIYIIANTSTKYVIISCYICFFMCIYTIAHVHDITLHYTQSCT